jgi:hypothetical protein
MTTSPPSNPPSAQPSPLATAAVAGVTDATLRQILADHWEHMMRWAPTTATLPVLDERVRAWVGSAWTAP